MPVKEFKCPVCGSTFEKLVKLSESVSDCPKCNAGNCPINYNGKCNGGGKTGGCGGNCSSCGGCKH